MKKASNKIPINCLKDCSSNKRMRTNKKKFCISRVRVVKIHFTKLKINSGKHGSSKSSKLTTHKKKLPKRGLDAEEKAVKKDKMRPKRIMKKRKLWMVYCYDDVFCSNQIIVLFFNSRIWKVKVKSSSPLLSLLSLSIYLKLLVTFIWSGSFSIKTECNTIKNQTICLLGQ